MSPAPKLRRDRDQLWAEAAHRESLIPRHENVNIPEALWADAAAVQEERRVKDPWEDLLATIPDQVTVGPNDEVVAIVHRTGEPLWEERVRSQDVLLYLCRVRIGDQQQHHTKRLSDVMRRIGWKRTKGGKLRVDGVSVQGYWRPDPKAPAQDSLPLPQREAAE